jgi:hypothetical protein
MSRADWIPNALPAFQNLSRYPSGHSGQGIVDRSRMRGRSPLTWTSLPLR